jgi:hypothetical protein
MCLVMKNKIMGKGALKVETSVTAEHDTLVNAVVNNVERDLIFLFVIIVEDKLEKEFCIEKLYIFFLL